MESKLFVFKYINRVSMEILRDDGVRLPTRGSLAAGWHGQESLCIVLIDAALSDSPVNDDFHIFATAVFRNLQSVFCCKLDDVHAPPICSRGAVSAAPRVERNWPNPKPSLKLKSKNGTAVEYGEEPVGADCARVLHVPRIFIR